MPALYDVLASQTITEFVPPSSTHQVQEVTVTAKPSGVVFPVHVQLMDMNNATLPKILGPLAESFNDLASYPGVADVQVQQDVKASGQIMSYIVVTVESDDGMQQQDVTLSWGQQFRGFGGYSKIDGVRANLNAINEG